MNVEHYRTEQPLPKEKKIITLSPYQLSTLMEFRGYSPKEKRFVPYAGLGGLLNAEEIALLKSTFSATESELEPHTYSDDTLKDLEDGAQDPTVKAVLKKIRKFIDVEVVTNTHLSDETAFKQLSLPTRYVVSQMKQDFFDNAKDELENDTVIVISRFKKPSPHYLKAIEEIKGENTIEKVAIALEDKDEKVNQVSHEFINVALIPKEFSSDHVQTLQERNKILNSRVDKNFEDDYAKAILIQTMLGKEMKGAMYGIVGVAACMPLLHLLNENFHDNALAQTLINFIPPFCADLVTFYAQLAPWLEGDTFSAKSTDFFKRLWFGGSHNRSFMASLVTTIAASAGAEITKQRLGMLSGSIFYGGVPFLVALMTTLDTVRSLQTKSKDKKSFMETLRIMFANNPLHLGIDTGALLAFLTAIGVLGVGGQMDNPTAKSLIEGVEEHAIASTFTMLQLYIGQTYQLQRRTERDLDTWMDKKLIGKNSFKTPSLEQEAPEE